MGTKIYCENCGRGCFGFWKYPPSRACSLHCFRELIANGKVSKIPPYAAFPELNISPPRKYAGIEERSKS